MSLSRADLCDRLRQKYGDQVTFLALTNGLCDGDIVQFDIAVTKNYGRKERRYRQGQAFLLFERPAAVGSGKVRELAIVIPAVIERNGNVTTPDRLFIRPVSTVDVVRRQGGSGNGTGNV